MRRLAVILLFLFSASFCAAKDSIFAYKIAAGLSYNHKIFTPDYNHSYATHFSGGTESRRNHDTSGYSPVIKAGIELLPGQKTIGLELSLFYNRTIYGYSIYNQRNGYSPIDTANWAERTETDYHCIRHHIGLAIGPVFHLKKLYLSPRFSLLLILSNEQTNESTEYTSQKTTTGMTSSSSEQSNSAVRSKAYVGGSGLAI